MNTSNGMRYVQLLALLGFIALSFYASKYHMEYYPTIHDLLSNPERYHNLITEQTGVMQDVTSDSFYLKNGDARIKVIGNNIPELKSGYTSVLGKFDKDGFIELKDIRNHNYDSVKYIVSLIGFAIFIAIFFSEWKLTKGGFKYAGLD
jgi:hypothetical protein